MSSLGFSAGATPARNYVHDWASEAWQEAVKGNVSLVAEHPALLAYCESREPACRFDLMAIKDIEPCPQYVCVVISDICDDCCPVDENLEQVTLQALLYNWIKSLDPHHLVTGGKKRKRKLCPRQSPTPLLLLSQRSSATTSGCGRTCPVSCRDMISLPSGLHSCQDGSDVGVDRLGPVGAVCRCRGQQAGRGVRAADGGAAASPAVTGPLAHRERE